MITDPDLYNLFKAESEEHLTRLDNGLLRLEKSPSDHELLEEVFRESHSLKGAARMLGLARIETAAHGLETIFNAARKGETSITPELITRMNAALTDLRQRVLEALQADTASQAAINPTTAVSAEQTEPQPDIPQATVHDPHAPAPLPAESNPQTVMPLLIETVRVETRKLDDLLTQIGELAVLQSQAQRRLMQMNTLGEQWTLLDRQLRGQAPAIAEAYGEETRVRFAQLLKQVRNACFDENARLASTVQLLGDRVSGMRLLPLSTLFGLFPRMVRDLAKAQGKLADLVFAGGELTVDKRILEEMKDPLMHLLRNAIDHGIETPGERIGSGKPQAATLALHAWREDTHISLQVSDDGRGLDAAAIGQAAVKRGLLEPSEPAALTPLQLQQLIFTSGFSTSRYVTEVSGLGVGLDVVRANVERMKGSVHLESRPGQGVTVRLRLPISVATTRLLLATIGEQVYGLPIESVDCSRRVGKDEIFTLDGRSAVMLNDEPLIVARLAELLELPEASSGHDRSVRACIVLQLDHGRLGLLVDELLDEEEVVPKPLGTPLKRVRNVSALATLGSGAICPVLNPADLLLSARRPVPAPHAESPKITEIHAETIRPAILLAEDSALIRAMEKRILEDARYEVVTAVDGVDALNQLGSRPFAAVVSDIMMPNMDGLTLTERIRATPRHQALPVILVTSLASDDDKRRGLDAGANAYIPKPTFDQRVLLDTLKRLI